MCNTPAPRHRAAWTLIILTFLIFRDVRKSPLRASCHQRSDGQKGTPLCASSRVIRRFTEGYPVAIRSSLLFFRERGNNSAQSSLSSLTPLGEPGALCASLPKLFPKVSPGPRLCTPTTARPGTRADAGRRMYRVYPGVHTGRHGMEAVYPP